MTPLTEQQKADLRARVLAGERLDLETCRLVVETWRANRFSAAEAAKASGKSSSKKKVMTDDELDADLDQFLGKGA